MNVVCYEGICAEEGVSRIQIKLFYQFEEDNVAWMAACMNVVCQENVYAQRGNDTCIQIQAALPVWGRQCGMDGQSFRRTFLGATRGGALTAKRQLEVL